MNLTLKVIFLKQKDNALYVKVRHRLKDYYGVLFLEDKVKEKVI